MEEIAEEGAETLVEREESGTDGGDYIDVGKFLELNTALNSEIASLGREMHSRGNSRTKMEKPNSCVNKRKMGPRIKILQTDKSNGPGKTTEADEIRPGGRPTRKRLSRKKPPKYCEEDDEEEDEASSKATKLKGKKGGKRKSRQKAEENARGKTDRGECKGPSPKGVGPPKRKKSAMPKERERPFVCEVCSRTFEYSTKLKQHAIIHTDHRPFGCHSCDAKFRSKADLCRHLRIHTRETPYSCDFCDKKFVQRAHLVRHTRTHTMEAPFECNFCGRRFNDNSHLTIHKRLHTGSRPYQCDECEKNFISSSNLQIHKRSHTLERSYVCPLCTRSFSTSGSLVRHIRTHTQEKPYQCEFCSKRFCDGSNLRVHRFIHTRDQRRPPEAGDYVTTNPGVVATGGSDRDAESSKVLTEANENDALGAVENNIYVDTTKSTPARGMDRLDVGAEANQSYF